jgi:hypothetical protein
MSILKIQSIQFATSILLHLPSTTVSLSVSGTKSHALFHKLLFDMRSRIVSLLGIDATDRGINRRFSRRCHLGTIAIKDDGHLFK